VRRNDLEVPANAEIVLEGYVNLNEMRRKDRSAITRIYSLEGEYPYSTWSRDASEGPDLPGDGGGRPPQEDFYMGYAIERVFLPADEVDAAEIVDVSMPAEGIVHNLMIVSIENRFRTRGKVMNAIWLVGQACFTK